MFPDSAIAKKYSSGHTKSTAIVKTMADMTVSSITTLLDSAPFSLSTDGSNDSNDQKLYPVLVTYFDKEKEKIVTSLIALLECSDNTGEGIFKVLNSFFEEKGLEWKNCISFGSDNASTMLGKFKGTVSFLQKEQPALIVRGCPCHLINLAAKAGTAMLIKSMNVEMLLTDIYYFLEKSSKRKNHFKLIQELNGQGYKPHKIQKYCSTRWLSLLDCINRVLEQWDSLKMFFCTDELEKDSVKPRFLKVKEQLESPVTKLYLLFLKSVLPLFNKANVLLQQEKPYIHKLRRELVELYMNLLVRFVKPNLMCENKESSLLDLEFSKSRKQKEDANLVIGAETRMYLNCPELSDNEKEEFFQCVRNFFVASCSYIVKKFPLEDAFLKSAEIADISLRAEAYLPSLLYMVERFPAIKQQLDLEKLEVEFAKYQIEDLKHIPQESSADSAWVEISKLKDTCGEPKYKVLPKLMLSILVVPHSNACSERIFSLVRKNQTEFRPNLGTATLQSLLIEKSKMFSSNEMCYSKQFTHSELKAAKQATLKMNSK